LPLSSLPIDNIKREGKGPRGFVSYMSISLIIMERKLHLLNPNEEKIWNVFLNKTLGNLFVKRK